MGRGKKEPGLAAGGELQTPRQFILFEAKQANLTGQTALRRTCPLSCPKRLGNRDVHPLESCERRTSPSQEAKLDNVKFSSQNSDQRSKIKNQEALAHLVCCWTSYYTMSGRQAVP